MTTSPRLADTVAKLFPQSVVAVDICGPVTSSQLLAEERRCVERAIERRVREFAAGRLCARVAMDELGLPQMPLLANSDRVPRWPSGVTGSISHTEGYCVAVVGLTSTFAGIGIDTERIGELHSSLWPIIFLPEEIAWLEGIEESKQKFAATVMFAAKEAFYKCQYSITCDWLDFRDVRVQIYGDRFSVAMRDGISSDHVLATLAAGRFLCDESRVVCGVAILAKDGPFCRTKSSA